MKKIAILGSTGSIGKTLIKIISKDKKNFEIILLTAEKNYKELLKQSKLLNVKNLIVTDKKSFNILKKKNLNKKIKIFNSLNCINKIFKKKIDYSMSSISGIKGLNPTLDMIKFSKKIAIANKESIICGWSLIKKNLKKYKTEFIPVDSEHFSIWSLINQKESNLIKKVYITASGGPFLNWPFKKIKNVSPQKALNHPNWSMGKKISIDSATMMNKVFEVIETQKIFNLPSSKVKILIHEKSYVHAIVEFNNGLKKILVHDTDMAIPIFNTIYGDNKKFLKSKNLSLNNLNNLNFKTLDQKKFPITKVINFLPKQESLFETVLVSANDELVDLFLKNKIQYNDIQKKLLSIIKTKTFLNYRNKKPNNINQIEQLSYQVRLKIRELCI